MARPTVHAGEARRYHQVPRLNVAVRLGSPSMVEAMTRGSVRRCQCWLLLRRSHSKKVGNILGVRFLESHDVNFPN